MDTARYRAAILDMDGVVTQTATLHARAWQQLFDGYLAARAARAGTAPVRFDSDADYRRYVDGKPRYDGVRDFLRARDIELPEGAPGDPPDAETIRGLGNRKDALFHALMRAEGVQVFPDAIAQINAWKARGLKIAIISSSRNCSEILRAAGVHALFDAQVDGRDLERLNMPGKPAPDMFLHAAQTLGVPPPQALIVEDAIAGVQAGRAGGFGLVVGVARDGHAEALRSAGADVVVHDLQALDEAAHAPQPPDAMDHIQDLVARLAQQRLALFLDYDGTLTPIVARPEQATLAPPLRQLLERIGARATVAIVSGRDLANVRAMVDLERLVYAGSHGYDIQGPNGLRLEHEAARAALPALDAGETDLHDTLAAFSGVVVERKRFAIAVHYRGAREADTAQIKNAVEATRVRHPALRMMAGKKVFELQPDVRWDKGRAVLWLREALGVEDALTLYLGDDVTDEDAFRALNAHGAGLGIVVGAPPHTAANYHLRDTAAVADFLARLERALGTGAPS